jgi:hypothetical protein
MHARDRPERIAPQDCVENLGSGGMGVSMGRRRNARTFRCVKFLDSLNISAANVYRGAHLAAENEFGTG